jgi:hypothetical protein
VYDDQAHDLSPFIPVRSGEILALAVALLRAKRGDFCFDMLEDPSTVPSRVHVLE